MTRTLPAITALALAACSSNNAEIVLSIDTTAGIPCEVDHIKVSTITTQGTAETVSTFDRDLSNVRLPLVVKLQDETARGSFQLQVSAFKGDVEVLRSAGQLTFSASSDLSEQVVLESTCTPALPCMLPEVKVGNVAAAPVTARFDCGANVRRYKAVASAELFRDACTGAGNLNSGAVLVGAHGAALLPLSAAAISGFGFRFYGKPILQIWAHEDGYISFAPNNPDPGNERDPGALDRDLRSAGVPPPPQSAMIFWDQLNLGPAGVCYALEGTPGTQKLRVTWTRACQIQPCGSDNLNFTIVLDERSQRISFTYGDLSTPSNAIRAQGGTATSGIVNDPKGCVAALCDSKQGLCMDGVTPCGYSQVFSNMPQTAGVQDVAFEPVIEPQ